MVEILVRRHIGRRGPLESRNWVTGSGHTKSFRSIGRPEGREPSTGGGGHVDAHANGCRISQRPLQQVDGGGGRGAPPFALYPSPQGSRKEREGQMEEWAQRPHKVDLMGRFHLNTGILSGGLLSEGVGTPDEEAVLIESRKGELCEASIESIEIGWSFLRGLGAPEETTLTGPNPIPMDFDLEDFLTRTLDTLGALNKWCEKCAGRFTVILPDCTMTACWFCVRHRGCLCCKVCERETDISGDWIDGTRLVDDSLSLNFHDMGKGGETNRQPKIRCAV